MAKASRVYRLGYVDASGVDKERTRVYHTRYLTDLSLRWKRPQCRRHHASVVLRKTRHQQSGACANGRG